MVKQKVAVGLSGGVDSAVSAALLLEQGYDVTGVFLECWRAPGCRVDEDRKDALDVALKLGIPYEVLDFKQVYKDKVVEYFYTEYAAGRTPNPDTMCNREIKFGMFYNWALRSAQGKPARFDFVATGHYARVQPCHRATVSPCHELVRGADEKKDQSYFLYQLRPEQLSHVLFPIGHMHKSEVRAEAEKRGLAVAKKPDSQGICFIGPVNVTEFLKERIDEKSGDIVINAAAFAGNFQGKPEFQVRKKVSILKQVQDDGNDLVIVGKHIGVPFYTIGQRIGTEIDQALMAKLSKKRILPFKSTEMPPLFVIDKDADTNTLIVGTKDQLACENFRVSDLNLLAAKDFWQESMNDCFVRIRHGGKLVRASVYELCDGQYSVDLAESIDSVASGQACVFYSLADTDAIVLAGGIIS